MGDPITPFIHLGLYFATALACLGLSTYTVIELHKNTKAAEAANKTAAETAELTKSFKDLATAISTNHAQELQHLTTMAQSMKDMAEANREFMMEQGKQMTALAVNQENLTTSVNDLLKDMIDAFRTAKEK